MSEAKSSARGQDAEAWSTPQKRYVGSLQYGQRHGFQLNGTRAAWHAASPQLLYLPNSLNYLSPDKFRGRADDEVSARPSPAWLQRASASAAGAEPVTPALWEGLPPVQPVWSTQGSTPGFHAVFGDSLFSGLVGRDQGGTAGGTGGGGGGHNSARTGPLESDHIWGDKRHGLLIDTHALKTGTFGTRSSKYNGVFKMPSGRWRSQLTLQGITVQLGTFKNEADAALAHDKAVVQVHGSSQAGTNFWVHPATAAAWLKERMSKNLANAVHELETAPEQQQQQEQEERPRQRRKRSAAGGATALSAMAAAAEEIGEEDEGETEEDIAYEPKASPGRPAHRRRKKG